MPGKKDSFNKINQKVPEQQRLLLLAS
jgi:hypothetical protein